MTCHFFNDIAFFIKKLKKKEFTRKKKIRPILIHVLILAWYQIKTHLQSNSQTHERERD